jgi:thiamine pyrophosphokinase
MPAEGCVIQKGTPSQAEGFSLPVKRVIIFANGEFKDPDYFRDFIRVDDFVIAADGGLNSLKRLARIPDMLIGDLDSVSESDVVELEKQNVVIKRFPVTKDETDLELALLEAVKMDCGEIILIGALGGRLDQTLANLFLLTLPQLENQKVVVENGDQEVFLIQKNSKIQGREGDTVSLIPFSKEVAGVTTIGLDYPLTNETLFFDRSRGVSNVMSTDVAEVQIKKGQLLCIHTRKSHLEEA